MRRIRERYDGKIVQTLAKTLFGIDRQDGLARPNRRYKGHRPPIYNGRNTRIDEAESSGYNQLKEKGEVRAGIHTPLIWEFRVIIIENSCTVLRGEAICHIFFQGAMHPRSASSAVGYSNEERSVSGINHGKLTRRTQGLLNTP